MTSTDFSIISSQETIRPLGLISASDHSPDQPNDGRHRSNADEPEGYPRLDEEAASDYYFWHCSLMPIREKSMISRHRS